MSYSTLSREICLKNQTNAQQIARKSRDANADILSKLNLRLPDKAIVEDRKDRNTYLLSPGSFQLTKLDSDRVIITGLGDCRIVSPVVINSELVMFNNIAFTGTTKDYLLKLKKDTQVIFNGCTFERTGTSPASNDTDSEKCFVYVEDGGKANFIGCAFFGGPAFVGYVVVNKGDAGNVATWGCVNLTGVAI